LQSTPEYWFQTRQPLNCLVFLAPLLVIYEWGVHHLGGAKPETIRNGADFWVRKWLPLSDHSPIWTFLLPGLLVLALIAWHLAGRYSSRISLRTFKGMYAESILFAFLLVMLGKVQQSLLLSVDTSVTSQDSVNQVITFIGAGIYEEFLFRLCLLPVVYHALRWIVSHRTSVVIAVFATSLLFSMAHYLGPGGEQFTMFSFVFRTTAGIYFSALFFLRGFGITVGCHAAYDILVGILLASAV